MQTTKNNKKEVQSIPVATRVTKPMHKAMLSILSVDAHINIADYLRDLIRKDLEDKGIVFDPTRKESPK